MGDYIIIDEAYAWPNGWERMIARRAAEEYAATVEAFDRMHRKRERRRRLARWLRPWPLASAGRVDR